MKYEAGQEVYDERGNAYAYIAANQGEHIVRELLEDEDSGEPFDGEVRVLRNLFATSGGGRQKLDAQLSTLQLQVTQAQRDLHEAQSAVRAANKEVQERSDRLKQHRELAYLDDFLLGKITHYVEISEYREGCEIVELNQTSNRRDRELRLLTLSPTAGYDGKVSWFLNRYSDGSGGNNRVLPCRSLEEAQEKAQEFLQGVIEGLLKKPDGQRYAHDGFHKCCQLHGVAIPQVLTDEYNERLVADVKKRREQLKQELAKIEIQLAPAAP